MPSEAYLKRQKDILISLVNEINNVNQKNNIYLKDKKILKFYFDYNLSNEGRVIRSVINDLVELNYLILDMKKKKILLNLNKINEICDKFNLENPYQNYNKLLINLEKFKKINNEIIKSELDNIDSILIKNLSINKFNDAYFKRLSMINEIENNRQRISKREFSTKHFNDSKCLENNASSLFSIIKKYYPELNNFNDYLIKNNIYLNNIKIRFKGNIHLKSRDVNIDINNDFDEISISLDLLEKLVIKRINFKNVYTVENLTTFNEFYKEDSLIIFSEGFANREIILFLKKLYEFNKNLNFYHFGDIDVGGFNIFIDLIEKSKVPFKPYNMNKEIFLKNISYAKELTENDINKLNIYLKDPRYEQFYEVIKVMIKTNKKLEQEALM